MDGYYEKKLQLILLKKNGYFIIFQGMYKKTFKQKLKTNTVSTGIIIIFNLKTLRYIFHMSFELM